MSQSDSNPAGATSTYPPSDLELAHTIGQRSEMLANFRFAADRDEAERQGRLWLLDFTSPIEGVYERLAAIEGAMANGVDRSILMNITNALANCIF
jgi:hypothetical protein